VGLALGIWQEHHNCVLTLTKFMVINTLLIPFLAQSSCYPPRWFFIVIKLFLEMIPKAFNGIKIRRLCQAYKNSEIIVLEPLLGQSILRCTWGYCLAENKHLLSDGHNTSRI